jgi:hypothetical protein
MLLLRYYLSQTHSYLAFVTSLHRVIQNDAHKRTAKHGIPLHAATVGGAVLIHQ